MIGQRTAYPARPESARVADRRALGQPLHHNGRAVGSRLLCSIVLLGLVFLLAPVPREARSSAEAEKAKEPVALGSLASPPSAATAFLTAYVRGDEAATSSLASPLYRAARERLDGDVGASAATPRSSREATATLETRLSFTFVGGVEDAGGFGHLLYVARPALARGPTIPSVFRVDVDPSGRVIWLEMVWLFDAGTGALHAVVGADLALAPLPSAPCCARTILGVASDGGREGYYALGLYQSDQGLGGAPARVEFFAVDSDGMLRPGAWTFGQDDSALVSYGSYGASYGARRPKPQAWHLPLDDGAMLDAYLGSLGG